MPPQKPSGTIPLQFSYQIVEFDPAEFDVAVRGAGVEFVHWRAMKCPVGMTDRDSVRRSHDDHSGCSNGFIYTLGGNITGLFTSNTANTDQGEIGLIDGSTVQVTTPRTYDDSDEEIMVAPFDRFYFADALAVTVPHWQLVETHVSGRDRLSFAPAKIVDIVDTHGKRYGVTDYTTEKDQLVWIGERPGFDSTINKGEIYAIRYNYVPYYYVTRVLHQVRLARTETALESGMLTRMPQSFILQRERVFDKEEKDELAIDPQSPRQVMGPRKGSYGPR
jgi:hypothetical protein